MKIRSIVEIIAFHQAKQRETQYFIQLTSHMDSYWAVEVDALLANAALSLNCQLPDMVLWLKSQVPITQHQMTTAELKKIIIIMKQPVLSRWKQAIKC